MRYLITMTVDIEEVRERKSRTPAEPLEPEPTVSVTQPPKHPIAFGIKDAALMLGISRSSVYILIKSGLLTPVKIGRRLLFTEEELRALVEKHHRQ